MAVALAAFLFQQRTPSRVSTWTATSTRNSCNHHLTNNAAIAREEVLLRAVVSKTGRWMGLPCQPSGHRAERVRPELEQALSLRETQSEKRLARLTATATVTTTIPTEK